VDYTSELKEPRVLLCSVLLRAKPDDLVNNMKNPVNEMATDRFRHSTIREFDGNASWFGFVDFFGLSSWLRISVSQDLIIQPKKPTR
jgi:hypothetical protein